MISFFRNIPVGLLDSAKIDGAALTGKMAEWFNPHVPFVVGAGFVIVGCLSF
jgi:ABC-type glycerol-3-phosphate transport system permease component